MWSSFPGLSSALLFTFINYHLICLTERHLPPHLFLVPGLYVPFLLICMFAPEYCWISTMCRPPGPSTAPTRDSLTSISILAISSSKVGARGGRGLPAVARPKELLFTGNGMVGTRGSPGNAPLPLPAGEGGLTPGRSAPGAAATRPVGP